jgi:hypothetical protein
MKDVADFVVGSTNRGAPQYSLFYRSIEHKTIRETAEDIGKKTFSSKYSHYVPIGGFTEEMKEFAAAICELQEKRHEADYDPHVRMKRSDVPAVVSTARAALAKYKSASADQRRAFLLLLLLKARPRDKDGRALKF